VSSTRWSRYVALGDSFTEGLNDDEPVDHPAVATPDRYSGWADRLAALLAADAEADGRPFDYANLAVRGRLLADVAGPQVDAALALGPDLVSIVGGGNDILRPRADVDRLAVQLDGAVARLRASGADVLLCTPVDPRFAPVIRHTRSRVATVTAHINAIARERGAYVIDMWAMRVLRDGRLWSTDRIHLTPEGHARVAAEAYAALTGAQRLGAPWREPLGDDLPETDLGLRANAAWAREHAAPWVRRRLTGRSSGDTVTPKRPQWRE
jgi:lysophospholipase L1-like esterase